MARPVVSRIVPEGFGLFIELGAVLPQRLDPVRTFPAIKPASRQQQPCRVDAIHKGVVGHEPWLPAQVDQCLDARAASAHVSYLGIMRQPVGALLVAPRLNLRDVMGNGLPGILVMIDEPDLISSN